MKRKLTFISCGRNKLLIFIFFIAIIACCIAVCHFNSSDLSVEVYVNGEPLYKHEVDATQEMNPYSKREDIVYNTVNDMLLIQYAKSIGITVSNDEIDAIIIEYKEHYPDIYAAALDGYGEDQLRQGTENRLLIEYALQHIYEDFSADLDINQEIINRYLIENNISPESLTDSEYQLLVESYLNTQKAGIKDSWLENARQTSDIVYP